MRRLGTAPVGAAPGLALLGTAPGALDPSLRAELEGAREEDLERRFGDMGIPRDWKVSTRDSETKTDGDKASVTIVDGTMTYSDEHGENAAYRHPV